MSIVAKQYEPRLYKISITEDEIIAFLVDGRTISVPLAWSCAFQMQLLSNVKIMKSLVMA